MNTFCILPEYTKKGIVISASLHVIFLGLFYLITTVKKAGSNMYQSAYTVVIQSDRGYMHAKKESSASQQGGRNPIGSTTVTPNLKQLLKPKNRQQYVQSRKPNTSSSNTSFVGKEKQATLGSRKIDKRGLYSVASGNLKKTGAILELTGWKWDNVPHPKDDTEECGKIVFEIKVDEYGEIVAIQTLEKTVSPLVEKIYLDALRDLSFSKLPGEPPSAKLSIGKVSFLLIPK